MKRIILTVLRLVVLGLLFLFAYQRISGKELDGAELRSWLDQELMDVTTRTGKNHIPVPDLTLPTSRGIDVGAVRAQELSGVKADITWNRDFYANLTDNLMGTQISLGKGDIFVTRTSSPDSMDDYLEVTVSGATIKYPAKYNADNAFARQNNLMADVYRANGIQIILSEGDYYVYYPAYSSSALQGVIMSIPGGNAVMMHDLVPLLYYRDRHLFTIQGSSGVSGIFYPRHGGLQTLGGSMIGGVGIDNELFAFHDIDSNKLYFLSLESMDIVKVIDMSRRSITFLGFVKKDDFIWLLYKDNLKNKMVYEKWKW